ncbi:hypothetical protein DPEC_G00251370 [Dallia pectoralis]|uniref:Uncharacterized protein n=1 Tax=Dallia pectoralis TaxID=75939 RepID=A0ACC2FTQ1_DALPE|nr:hypothetical protein DPEC_G00251370 [Dallia pectoralis]
MGLSSPFQHHECTAGEANTQGSYVLSAGPTNHSEHNQHWKAAFPSVCANLRAEWLFAPPKEMSPKSRSAGSQSGRPRLKSEWRYKGRLNTNYFSVTEQSGSAAQQIGVRHVGGR